MSAMSDYWIAEMEIRFDNWSPRPDQNEPCQVCGQPYWMHNGKPVCPAIGKYIEPEGMKNER